MTIFQSRHRVKVGKRLQPHVQGSSVTTKVSRKFNLQAVIGVNRFGRGGGPSRQERVIRSEHFLRGRSPGVARFHVLLRARGERNAQVSVSDESLDRAGDRLRFEPVGPDEFAAIATDVAAGRYVPWIEAGGPGAAVSARGRP